MKLNLDYTGDSRWEQMSNIHKTSLPIPNLFVSLLYQYQDKIPNLNEIKNVKRKSKKNSRVTIKKEANWNENFKN